MFKKFFGSLKKKHKYSTRFEAIGGVKIYSPSEEDKYILKASLDKLKPFLPKEVDLERNYDLIGFTTPAANANRINLNDQYVDGAILKKIAPLWRFKQTNWEHSSDIIGCCVDYHWVEFATDNPLTEEQVDELIAKKEPFTLVLSGYLWIKALDDDQLDKIYATNDPNSELYGALKSSWEVYFNSFNIGIKDRNNNISFITDDEEVIARKDNLRHFSGSGYDKDGNMNFLNLLEDDLLPNGLGLTFRPAAQLNGGVFAIGGKSIQEPAKLTETEEESTAELNDNESVTNTQELDSMKIKAENELVSDDDKNNKLCKCGMENCECEHDEVEETDEEEDEVEGKKKKIPAVYNGKTDETKFGPTNSPIVDTAFSSNLNDVESRLKTTIKAFSKNNLTDEQIAARLNVLKKVDLKEVFSWNESNFETNYAQVVASIHVNKTEKDKKSKESVNNLEKTKKDCVIAKTTNLNNRKNKSMKLTDIKELTDEKLVAGEVTAGVIAEFLSDKIEKIGAEWAAKEKEKADALALATENASSIKAELDRVSAELESLRNEAVAREKAEVFNTRISALTEDFEFSDEQREIVASEIKDLDSDGFDKYVKKLELFAKKKVKQTGKDKEDEKLGEEVHNLKKDMKDAKASELFASLKADEDQVVPPNAASSIETFKERWKANFENGGIKITK